MRCVCLVNLTEEGTLDLLDKGEHLGLNSIAAYLESKGFPVQVIDANFHEYTDDEVIGFIKSYKPIAVGFSLYERMLERVVRISKEVKQTQYDIHISLGGHNASFNASAILSAFREIDTIIIGEGEETYFQLITAIVNDSDWKCIDGIAYYDGVKCQITSPRTMIPDLDVLPFARRSGPIEGIRIEYLNIYASRGCYARCSFCTTPVFYGFRKAGNRHRARSVNHLLDEIEYLLNLYGTKVKFWFADDNFIHIKYKHPKWFDEFVNGIAAKQLKISFGINIRPDDVTEDLFTQLKDAGLSIVFIGVESGVQETLDLYRKEVKVETSKKAISILHCLGLALRIGWIMYNPYTTLEHLYRNIAFLKEIGYFTNLKQYRYPISLKGSLSIYPGTKILDMMNRKKDIVLYRTQNLDYKYEFKEPRIDILLGLLREWRERIKHFILKDSLYLMEVANNNAQQELKSKIERVSDAFMLLDLKYYENVLNLVSSKYSEQQVKRKHQEIFSSFVSQLEVLDIQLSNLQRKLLVG